MAPEPFELDFTAAIVDGPRTYLQDFSLKGFWTPRTLTEGPKVVHLTSVVPLYEDGEEGTPKTTGGRAAFLILYGGAIAEELEEDWCGRGTDADEAHVYPMGRA